MGAGNPCKPSYLLFLCLLDKYDTHLSKLIATHFVDVLPMHPDDFLVGWRMAGDMRWLQSDPARGRGGKVCVWGGGGGDCREAGQRSSRSHRQEGFDRYGFTARQDATFVRRKQSSYSVSAPQVGAPKR